MRQIQVLDPETVARIAAGEVIQQPSNVVKELLENAIDAGATTIHLLTSGNFFDLILVCDTGSGIHLVDFPLLCHRFATSKIETFVDIYSVQSFGFRGEALASISFISHVVVISKVVDHPAYAAAYRDGELLFAPIELQDRDTESLIYTLESDSFTMIWAMDLFYMDPIKRGQIRCSKVVTDIRSLFLSIAAANYNNEYSFSIISDVQAPKQNLQQWLKDVTDTSGLVSFALSSIKAETKPISFPIASSRYQRLLQIVSVLQSYDKCEADALYLHSIAKENVCSTCKEIALYFTEPIDHSKQNKRLSNLLVFINGRWVQYPRLRNAVQCVIDACIPAFSTIIVAVLWVITTPGGYDPNVHPSKERVLLLEEDMVYASIIEELTSYMKQQQLWPQLRLQSQFQSQQQDEPIDLPQPKLKHSITSSPNKPIESNTTRLKRSTGPPTLGGSLYKQRQDPTMTSILRFVNVHKQPPSNTQRTSDHSKLDVFSTQATSTSSPINISTDDIIPPQNGPTVQQVQDIPPRSSTPISVPPNYIFFFEKRFSQTTRKNQRLLARTNILSILNTLPTTYESGNLPNLKADTKLILCGTTLISSEYGEPMLLAFAQSTELALLCIDVGRLLLAKMLVCYSDLLCAQHLSRDIYYTVAGLNVPVQGLQDLLNDYMLGVENNSVVLAPHLLVLLAQQSQMYDELTKIITRLGLVPRLLKLRDLLDNLDLNEDAYTIFPRQYAELFIDTLVRLAKQSKKAMELNQILHILSPTLFGDDEWRCYTLAGYSLKEVLRSFNRIM